jgi:O-antigen/teichoic acid export membrane protein
VAVAAAAHSSVVLLAALALSGPLISQAVSAIVLVRRAPWLVARGPRDAVALPTLFRSGGLFFTLQLASAVAFTSDQVVIARVLDADSVSRYAVPARLFAVIGAVAMIAVRPLWPAYAEASATGDLRWIRSTLRKSVAAVALISTALAVAAVLGRGPLLRALSRGEVVVTFGTIAAFAVWGVLSSVGNAVAMFLNGLGIIRFQVIVASVMAVTNLALSIWLAGAVGVAGVVWGSVFAYGLTVCGPYYWYVRRWNRSVA